MYEFSGKSPEDAINPEATTSAAKMVRGGRKQKQLIQSAAVPRL